MKSTGQLPSEPSFSNPTVNHPIPTRLNALSSSDVDKMRFAAQAPTLPLAISSINISVSSNFLSCDLAKSGLDSLGEMRLPES